MIKTARTSAKVYKSKTEILVIHTKMFHVAQNFDILRNADKKVLKNSRKYTILTSK